MRSRKLLVLILLAGTLTGLLVWAQQGTIFRVKVDLVVLNVTVTNRQNKYVTGLKPTDFKVTEDGITQKVSFFGEGNQAPVALDRKSTRLNSSHIQKSRMPSSA